MMPAARALLSALSITFLQTALGLRYALRSSQLVNRYAAEEICITQHGGVLAEPRSVSEQVQIAALIIVAGEDLPPGSCLWAGGVVVQQDWVWPTDQVSIGYESWLDGYPDDESDKKCMCMSTGLGNNWKNVDCGARMHTICQRVWLAQ